MHENCYQVLGVARTASPAEVRAAFVREVKRHHPDALGLNAMRQAAPLHRLHDIQAAYRVLSNPEARAAHDRTLEAFEHHHFNRQRAVQRRLRHYDRRYPRPAPRPYRKLRWRALMIIALGAAIVARLALQYQG